MRALPDIVLLAATAALAGCHDSSGGDAPPELAGAPIAPISTITAGHLTGIAGSNGIVYTTEGVLTGDGELRLHVFLSDGLNTYQSFQFVGSSDAPGAQVAGQGAIVGQFCTAAMPSKFCGTATTGSIALVVSGAPAGRLTGEMRVAAAAGTEVWILNLGYSGRYSSFHSAEELADLRGLYRERLAEFSPLYDATIDLDPAGRLFFQDAATGCTGNGALTSNDASFYAVTLTVGSCNANHATLNAEFAGLAVFQGNSPWDYGPYEPVVWHMWLSTRPGNAPPAALVTRAVAN